MKVLMPGFSCVVSAGFENDPDNELAAAISQGYSRVFVETSSGLLLHQNLPVGRGGAHRYVRLPIAALPDGKKPLSVGPALNFLPDGKIPVELLLKVQAFFKGVMARHKQKLEAMIWIVWNEERGYHLLVPKQTVGAASARYEWGDIPAGTMVVVDIHSHADMNAFFSGTDNNDDSNSIRYSGVIGHNSRPVPEMMFRFNFLGKYIEQKVDDIFCSPQPVVEAPPEDWYEQISLYSHTYQGGQGGTPGNFPGYPFQGYGRRGMDGNSRRQKVQEEGSEMDEAEAWFARKAGFSGGIETSEDAPAGGTSGFGSIRQNSTGLVKALENGTQAPGLRRVPNPKGLALDKVEGSIFQSNNGLFFTDGEDLILPYDPVTKTLIGYPGTEVVVLSAEEVEQRILQQAPEAPPVNEVDEQDAVERAIRREMQEELLSGPTAAALRVDFQEDSRFDAMAINYGTEAATAYLLIEELSPQLANAGDILRDSISSMFELVDDDDRLRVFRSLAEDLSEKDRADLAQNGL